MDEPIFKNYKEKQPGKTNHSEKGEERTIKRRAKEEKMKK